MVVNIADTKKHLTEAGIKPSIQRIQIFNFLYYSKNHPTVESIYNALSPTIPTLSKTTIYNTLKLFHKQGLTNVVQIENNEARYDADISTHGHFKCISCDKLIDFEIPDNLKLGSVIEDNEVTEYHYYLKGICKDCKTK